MHFAEASTVVVGSISAGTGAVPRRLDPYKGRYVIRHHHINNLNAAICGVACAHRRLKGAMSQPENVECTDVELRRMKEELH